MRTPLAAVLAIVLTFGCTDTSVTSPDAVLDAPDAAAASANLQNEKLYLGSFSVFVPCANGGAGELVVASDVYLHVIYHVNTNSGVSGSDNVFSHMRPIGNWDGIGQVTGDVYQATGSPEIRHEGLGLGRNGNTVATSVGFVGTFRWIGPGPGNNFLVHRVAHVTRVDGELTASVLNESVECR